MAAAVEAASLQVEQAELVAGLLLGTLPVAEAQAADPAEQSFAARQVSALEVEAGLGATVASAAAAAEGQAGLVLVLA